MLRLVALTATVPALLFVLLLTGCVAVGNSNLADKDTLAQIKVGETTKQQVTALLGEPSTGLAGYHRDWWTYRYASSTINPLEYLLLYGFLTNGLGLFDTRHDLQVFFDANGVVRALSLQVTSYDMGSPVSALHITSTASYAVVIEGHSGKPISFTDKMDYRY